MEKLKKILDENNIIIGNEEWMIPNEIFIHAFTWYKSGRRQVIEKWLEIYYLLDAYNQASFNLHDQHVDLLNSVLNYETLWGPKWFTESDWLQDINSNTDIENVIKYIRNHKSAGE